MDAKGEERTYAAIMYVRVAMKAGRTLATVPHKYSPMMGNVLAITVDTAARISGIILFRSLLTR